MCNLSEGIARAAYEKGYEEGIKIGENNVNKSLSVDLYASGYKPERIAEMLEVSLEQVMEWIEEN